MSHFRAAAANARPTIMVDGAGAGVVSHPGTYPPVDVDLADQEGVERRAGRVGQPLLTADRRDRQGRGSRSRLGAAQPV
jgi:hypothetical protein